MSVPGKFRVTLWTVSPTDRGRGDVAAIIDDALNIGCREAINDGGEVFFTLPYNHPQIEQVQPLKRHYSVQRWNGSSYDVLFNGLVTDMDAKPDEIILYGESYLCLLQTTIENNILTYSNVEVGTIMTQEFTNARSSSPPAGDNTQESRVEFISLGTIQTTGVSATAYVAYTPRLEFLKEMAEIVASSTTALPIFYISRSSPFTFEFRSSRTTYRPELLFEYGGNVRDYRYIPYGPEFSTHVRGIGQKRDGSTVLYSSQTWAAEATYGHISRARVYGDIVNQTALDRKDRRDARRYGKVGMHTQLAVHVNGLIPWYGFELGDRVPVRIQDGPVDLDDRFIIGAIEYYARPDGTEWTYITFWPEPTPGAGATEVYTALITGNTYKTDYTVSTALSTVAQINSMADTSYYGTPGASPYIGIGFGIVEIDASIRTTVWSSGTQFEGQNDWFVFCINGTTGLETYVDQLSYGTSVEIPAITVSKRSLLLLLCDIKISNNANDPSGWTQLADNGAPLGDRIRAAVFYKWVDPGTTSAQYFTSGTEANNVAGVCVLAFNGDDASVELLYDTGILSSSTGVTMTW